MTDEQKLMQRMLELQKALKAGKQGITQESVTPEEQQAADLTIDEQKRQEILKKVEEIMAKQKG